MLVGAFVGEFVRAFVRSCVRIYFNFKYISEKLVVPTVAVGITNRNTFGWLLGHEINVSSKRK